MLQRRWGRVCVCVRESALEERGGRRWKNNKLRSAPRYASHWLAAGRGPGPAPSLAGLASSTTNCISCRFKVTAGRKDIRARTQSKGLLVRRAKTAQRRRDARLAPAVVAALLLHRNVGRRPAGLRRRERLPGGRGRDGPADAADAVGGGLEGLGAGDAGLRELVVAPVRLLVEEAGVRDAVGGAEAVAAVQLALYWRGAGRGGGRRGCFGRVRW
jgi:hypothetical protein